MSNLEYYKPSKSYSLWFYPALIIMLFIIAPLLSIVYAELQNYFHDKIFNIIIYVALLFVLRFLVVLFKFITKLSSSTISKIFTWVFILIVFYLQHSANLYISIHNVFDDYGITSSVNIDGSADHYFSIAMHPKLLWTYFNLQANFWEVVVWVLEFLGFVFIALTGGLHGKLEPYSFKTNSFYDISSFPINQIDKELLLNAISNKDYSKIGFLEKHIEGDDSYSIIDIYTSVNEPTYMSLSTVVANKDSDSTDINKEIQIQFIRIDKELEKLLLDINNPKRDISDSPNNNDILFPEKEIYSKNEPMDVKIFFTLGVGILSLFWGIYIDDAYSIGIGIFLFTLTIITVIAFIRVAKLKVELALSINPSKIKFYKLINMSNEDIVLNTDDIKKVNLDVDYEKGTKFNIHFKNNNRSTDTVIVLDIFKANFDSFELEKKLKLLINTTAEERVKLLEEWE